MEDDEEENDQDEVAVVEKEVVDAGDELGGGGLRGRGASEDEGKGHVVAVDVLGGEVGPNEDGEGDGGETGGYEHAGFDGVETRDGVGGQDPEGLVEHPEDDDAADQQRRVLEEVEDLAAEEVGEEGQEESGLDAEEHDEVVDAHVPDDFW